ncbi:8039_t:CDS:2, partial [Ambispora gerdemannii]
FTVDHTETESELTNLIFQMPQVSDSHEEQMTDEEIVKFVTGEEAQEPENHEELSIPITTTDALEGLGKIIKYLQQENTVDVNLEVMKMLSSLNCQIIRRNFESRQQSTLINYFPK